MDSNYTKKQHTVKVSGRTFNLAFPLRAMLEMQNRIEGFNFNEIDKMVSKPEMLLPMLVILAENGAMLNGEKLDVDQDWFALHTPANVRKLISLQLAVIETITDGMSMETEEDDDREREVDLVLQEIQKKSQTTDSPGEKSQPGD